MQETAMSVALLALVALAAVQPACSSSLHRQALDDTILVDSQLQWSTRTLQNAATAADVVAVSTAAELRAALSDAGSSHIVLNEHLDLTAIGSLGGSSYLFGLIPENIKSIRGNCSTAPPASMTPPVGFAELQPLSTGQCVLLASDGLLRVQATQLWLDALYVRLRAPKENFKQFIAMSEADSELYLTRVTMQGDGGHQRDCLNCGLALGQQASLYAQDCMFMDFGGSRTTLLVNSQASYVRCAFERNTLYTNAQGSAIIEAEGPSGTDFDTVVWLEDTSFGATTPAGAAAMLVDNRGAATMSAAFYSDSTTPKVCTYPFVAGEDAEVVPECDETNPNALGSIRSFETPFIAGVLEELGLETTDLLPTPASFPTTTATNTTLNGTTIDTATNGTTTETATNGTTTATDGTITETAGNVTSTETTDGTSDGTTTTTTSTTDGTSETTDGTNTSDGTSEDTSAASGTDEDSGSGMSDGSTTTSETTEADTTADDVGASSSGASPDGTTTEPGASSGTTGTTAGDDSSSRDGGSGGGGGGLGPGTIIAAAVAGGVLLLALLVGLFLLGKRRGRKTAANREPQRTFTLRSHMESQDIKSPVPPECQPPMPTRDGPLAPRPAPADVGYCPTMPRRVPSQNFSVSVESATPSTSVTTPHHSAMPSLYNAANAPPSSGSGMHAYGSFNAPPGVRHYMRVPPPLPPKVSGGASFDSPYGFEDLPAGPPVATPPCDPEEIAPQAATGFCALAQVPTYDSVTNYASKVVGYTSGTGGSAPPSKDAPMADWREHLGEQLDLLCGKKVGESLMVLPGRENRLMGGQAVVQIVEDTRSRQQLAVKFFLSPNSFEQEKKLYVDPTQPLGRFLPQLHSIAEPPDGCLLDVFGQAMPPCIIMEKGEAMDVWVDKSGEDMDMFTGLQVLSHIAERLKDLHAAGYVHRDIKPGNIMWLPRKKRWTLIDFGCAARTGSNASTGFSLYYAAPEVLSAYLNGACTVVATEALDAWSLGVLAIELFSGKPVFDHLRPKAETMAMILGNQPAPWEDLDTSRAMLRPLGIFKQAVLGLIDRDPAQRTSIHAFQRACRSSLSSTATTTPAQ